MVNSKTYIKEKIVYDVFQRTGIGQLKFVKLRTSYSKTLRKPAIKYHVYLRGVESHKPILKIYWDADTGKVYKFSKRLNDETILADKRFRAAVDTLLKGFFANKKKRIEKELKVEKGLEINVSSTSLNQKITATMLTLMYKWVFRFIVTKLLERVEKGYVKHGAPDISTIGSPITMDKKEIRPFMREYKNT